MKDTTELPKIQLTPPEIKIISMALQTMIEDMTATSKDQTLPFNGIARQAMKEMIDSAKSAQKKIYQMTGLKDMPDYEPGDEDEFLTKQS